MQVFVAGVEYDQPKEENLARQIRRAYQLALNREPNAEELSDTLPAVQKHGLAVLCRALFNSNEFLFAP